MTRRAVFVDPGPSRVTHIRLLAELTAAGVPMPLGELDFQYISPASVVVIEADTDQWDVTVRQVVAAHIPDALLIRKQRRKARIREILAARDELIVLLTAANRVLYDSLVETRATINQMRSQILAAGIHLTVAALQNRTWEVAQAATLVRADGEIEAEPD